MDIREPELLEFAHFSGTVILPVNDFNTAQATYIQNAVINPHNNRYQLLYGCIWGGSYSSIIKSDDN